MPFEGGMVTRILVVDDSIMVQMFVRRVLTRAGYTVTSARDGVEALAALSRSRPPALVLSDVDMPNIGGIELLETLRVTCNLSVPFVLMTDEPTIDLVLHARALGANARLRKPLRRPLLLATVERLTAGRGYQGAGTEGATAGAPTGTAPPGSAR